MTWKSPYIIVRVNKSSLKIMHSCENLREAKYYLKHFSDTNDSIFITPVHEKHNKSERPTYMCHKRKNGRMDFHEEAWYRQMNLPASPSFLENQNPKETAVVEIGDLISSETKVNNLLSAFNLNTFLVNCLFSEPNKWSTWDSSVLQKSKDTYVISIRSGSSWPLTLILETNKDGKTSDLKFEVSQRMP